MTNPHHKISPPEIKIAKQNVNLSDSKKACKCGRPHLPRRDTEAAVWCPGSSAPCAAKPTSIIELVNPRAKTSVTLNSTSNQAPGVQTLKQKAWKPMSERRKGLSKPYIDPRFPQFRIYNLTSGDWKKGGHLIELTEKLLSTHGRNGRRGGTATNTRNQSLKRWSIDSIGPVGQERIGRACFAVYVGIMSCCLLSIAIPTTSLAFWKFEPEKKKHRGSWN